MPSSTREERVALRPNRVLDRVRAGKYVLCGSTTPYPSPKIAEMMGLIGFDCVWIDMEHQDFSYDQAFNICLGARAAQMESMIRVRKAGDYSFFRVFEAGATGIMVPHIRSMEEAKWALKFCRFYPVGLRGMDGGSLEVKLPDQKVVGKENVDETRPVLVSGPAGEVVLLHGETAAEGPRRIVARRLSLELPAPERARAEE